MRSDIDLTSLPLRHDAVHLFLCKRLNRMTLVSGNTVDEAVKRLIADNEAWNYSRTHLSTFPLRALELARMLDEHDVPYIPSQNQTLREGAPSRYKERNGNTK